MKEEAKGHLIIHDITLEESKLLMNTLKKHADWWPQNELDKLDGAAAFAMFTHGFSKTNKKNIIALGVEE
jgi:hypothetical protein